MSNQVVTREAVPQVDRSIKDYSLIRKVIGAYDPAEVATLISPKETMGGDNYIWVGASAAEAIIAALAAGRLAEVKRVLDLPCGHGRVLRHLVNMFPDAQFDACDLDPDGINFCATRADKEPRPAVLPSFSGNYPSIALHRWLASSCDGAVRSLVCPIRGLP